jgi:hypothetical protein
MDNEWKYEKYKSKRQYWYICNKCKIEEDIILIFIYLN